MEGNLWTRSSASPLWTLLEWSAIGAGLIFTLIGLSVSGFLTTATTTNGSPAEQRRRQLKHKRVLIITKRGGSKLTQTLVHLLRNHYDCEVISLSSGGGERGEGHQENATVICDLRNSQECRQRLQEIWHQEGGIDVVIKCELEGDGEKEEARSTAVEQRVDEIGSTIQGTINLLINLVPKMMTSGGGTVVWLRNQNHHQNGHKNVSRPATEFDELVEQLMMTSSSSGSGGVGDIHQVTTPKIDLVQLLCRGAGEEGQHQSVEEQAERVIKAIESGQRGILELSNDLWTLLIRKCSKRWSEGNGRRLERSDQNVK